VVEGLGAAFVGVFLAAYFSGLLVACLESQPLTMVLHSEPVFRVPLFLVGGLLLFVLLSTFVPLILSEDQA
jgi:hypothetical protein